MAQQPLLIPGQTDGLQIVKREVAIALRQANSQQAQRAILQKLTFCVSGRGQAAFLEEQGIRALLVRRSELAEVLERGLCDIAVTGDAAQVAGAVLEQNTQPSSGGDDVQVEPPRDRDAPEILPDNPPFTAALGQVRVSAVIRDRSAIRTARLDTVNMRPVGGGRYAVDVDLPDTYQPQTRVITAQDRWGNSSRLPVVIQRLPYCGPRRGLSVQVIRKIQADFRTLGYPISSIDGLLGPNTCGVITQYLGDDRIDWPDLQARLDREFIRIDSPDALDVGQGERDLSVIVSDPRLTGAIANIAMIRPDGSTQTEAYSGQSLPFRINWEVTEPEILRFEARDRRGAALAVDRTRVIPPRPVQITLNGDAIRGARLTTPERFARVTVTLDNAPGNTVVGLSGAGAVQSLPYDGPVTFEVPMPTPDNSGRAVFQAIRGDRVLASDALELVTPTASLSVIPDDELISAEARDDLDLRVTGRVSLDARVMIERGGQSDGAIPVVGGGIARLQLDMPPPGQREEVILRLVSAGRELDQQTVTLVRRLPVSIAIEGNGVRDGRASGVGPTTRVFVRLQNAPDGTVVMVRGAPGGPVERAYRGTPVPFDLDMPAPGGTARVQFLALRDGQDLAQVMLELTTLAATLRLDPAPELRSEAPVEMVTVQVLGEVAPGTRITAFGSDGAPLWEEEARSDAVYSVPLPLPRPGQADQVSFRLSTGTHDLDRQELRLFRVVPEGPPDWLWPSVILGAILAAIYAALRIFRRPAKPPVPAAPPKLRVIAVPDEVPELSLEPTDLPALRLEVAPDTAPEWDLIFDEEGEPPQ